MVVTVITLLRPVFSCVVLGKSSALGLESVKPWRGTPLWTTGNGPTWRIIPVRQWLGNHGDFLSPQSKANNRSGATPDQMLRAAATAPGAQLAAQRIQRQKPLPLPCLGKWPDPMQFMTVNFLGWFFVAKKISGNEKFLPFKKNEWLPFCTIWNGGWKQLFRDVFLSICDEWLLFLGIVWPPSIRGRVQMLDEYVLQKYCSRYTWDMVP